MDNPSKINAFSRLTFMPISDSIAVYLMMKGQITLWN
tara:strand:- start:398 stop:508 length:111 start_codon:yes stop_codon:yes gene_type:complete